MKRITFILLLFYFFQQIITCYALDGSTALRINWKPLHEEADKNNLSKAEEDLKRNPRSIEALYTEGLIFLNLHEDKKAEENFKKIIEIDPKIIEARWALAELLRRQHNLSASEKILTEIIKSYPGFSPTYISLAYIKYIQMDFVASVRLATSVIRQGRKRVDLSNYVRALLIISGSKGMIAHYGGPLSKLINGTAVFPYLKKAEALQPDSPVVLFGLGSFYLLAPHLAGGNLVKAKVYLEKAIKLDKRFSDAYVRLAQLYKVKGDNKNYRLYLDKALELDPENELALDIKSGRCSFICPFTEKRKTMETSVRRRTEVSISFA